MATEEKDLNLTKEAEAEIVQYSLWSCPHCKNPNDTLEVLKEGQIVKCDFCFIESKIGEIRR
jgi:CRISPR/Cas system-associated protein Cas10 (large subunit of type III CRISPR-Cas system)